MCSEAFLQPSGRCSDPNQSGSGHLCGESSRCLDDRIDRLLSMPRDSFGARLRVFVAVALVVLLLASRVTVVFAQGRQRFSGSTSGNAILPPAFDRAMQDRIERAELFTQIPIDLEWGLP